MLQSPKMVSYQVSDLQKAKEWYAGILDRAPAFDSPMACIFTIDACSLTLLPAGKVPEGTSGGIVYWNVEDIDAAYQRLLDAGATTVTEITLLLLSSRIARPRDPFGNVIGIVSASKKKTSIEDRPSESALTVAFCRALSTYEDKKEVCGPDYLAEIFVGEESKKSLKDPAARQWMARQFCGTYEYFIARTAYGDDIFAQSLQECIPQIVLLGAGYDTRSYRFRDLNISSRIFELDAPPTQRRKRDLLKHANISELPQLSYVPINFEKETLADVLSREGFDKEKKTLFVWEGVTYYLSPEAVDLTLAFMRKNSPPGSTLFFDYMIQAKDIENRYGVKTVLQSWKRSYSSEHVQFGIEEGNLESFLSGCGFRLLENLTPEQMEKRFLMLKDGSLYGHAVALFNLAHAMVC
jgi:methyltransferase (TIGR00027 family)